MSQTYKNPVTDMYLSRPNDIDQQLNQAEKQEVFSKTRGDVGNPRHKQWISVTASQDKKIVKKKS